MSTKKDIIHRLFAASGGWAICGAVYISFCGCYNRAMAEKSDYAPCIRCGECIPACPAGLSPLKLFALWQDAQVLRMAAEESLGECFLCRRCDDVCPSALPLADSFAAARRQTAEMRHRRDEAVRLRARHDSHLQRLSAPHRVAELDVAALAARARTRAAAKLGRRS